MRCGISTACFYPMDTVEALKAVADAGVAVTEVFFNAFGEMEDSYLHRLLEVKRAYGIDIGSVHPCSSVLEGFFFASDYPGKLRDGERLYRRWFEICRTLDATKLVFHGDHDHNAVRFGMNEYACRFNALALLGREYGVALCHENVAYCRVNTPEVADGLRQRLPQTAAFVLDIKQLRRKKGDIPAMLKAMGEGLKLVHISDYSTASNCLPPGQGRLDIPGFIERLRKQGFDGDLIIEVYSDSFDGIEALVRAKQAVDRWLEG